jgi:hypothetical protein
MTALGAEDSAGDSAGNGHPAAPPRASRADLIGAGGDPEGPAGADARSLYFTVTRIVFDDPCAYQAVVGAFAITYHLPAVAHFQASVATPAVLTDTERWVA